ncbi:serine hydrolase [Spirillospora sp. NPDC029432]|uniref:serine hydrolase n=1 Tax=Spirillospora sp. NPDC029432 TaxID=3154599 RepID=UPI0034559242
MRPRTPLRRAAAAAVTAACAALIAAAPAVPPSLHDGAVPVPVPGPEVPVTLTPVPPDPSPPVLTAERRERLARSLDRYLEDRQGRLSVAVRDLESGLAFSYEPRLRTATASIVKVEIVMALLLQAQREDRSLTAAERSLAERAITVSDNDAATALWHAIGGGPGLAKAGRRLGLEDTEPGPGTAWGATTTSAADQVRLLAALASGGGPLTGRNRRYVLDLMGEVAPEQAWGVSAAAAGGAAVALKNGWLPREVDGGAWTVNSVGRVRAGGRDLLIAVVSDRHPSMAAGVAAVEHAAAAVAAALSDTPSDTPADAR